MPNEKVVFLSVVNGPALLRIKNEDDAIAKIKLIHLPEHRKIVLCHSSLFLYSYRAESCSCLATIGHIGVVLMHDGAVPPYSQNWSIATSMLSILRSLPKKEISDGASSSERRICADVSTDY